MNKFKLVIELETDQYNDLLSMERMIRESIKKAFFIEPIITKLEIKQNA